jgi:hypothetical protein
LRVKYRCISAYHFYSSFYLHILSCISFYSRTCRVPTISVLNLAISPCCKNMLLKSWRRFGVLLYGLLGERLPRSIACGVMVSFCCDASESVRLVFCKILFCNKYYILWHLLFCIHFLYGMCENLFLGTHTMSIRFGHKIRCDNLPSE